MKYAGKVLRGRPGIPMKNGAFLRTVVARANIAGLTFSPTRRARPCRPSENQIWLTGQSYLLPFLILTNMASGISHTTVLSPSAYVRYHKITYLRIMNVKSDSQNSNVCLRLAYLQPEMNVWLCH